MAKIIGKIAVKVYPDTSGFRKAAEAMLQREKKRMEDKPVEVPMDVDENETDRNVDKAHDRQQKRVNGKPLLVPLDVDGRAIPKAIQKSMQRINKKAHKIQVKFDADRALSDLRDKLHSDIADLNIKVNVEKQALRDYESELVRLRKSARSVADALRLDPNNTGLREMDAGIEKMRRNLEHGASFRINNINQFKAQMREAQEAAAKIQIDPRFEKRIGRANQSVRRMQEGLSRIDTRTAGTFTRMGNGLNRAAVGGDRFSDTMGRAFGRGSRNNMLHFTGTLTRLGSKIIPSTVRAASSLSRGIGMFFDVFKQSRALGVGRLASGLNAAKTSMGSFAKSLKGGLPAIAAVGAALIGFTKIITTLPAGIGMAVGWVTSLASSLTYALLGSLLPIIPAAIAVGGGIAVMAGAFARMDKAGGAAGRAMTKIKSSINGLKKELDGVARQIGPSLAKVTSTVLGGLDGVIKRYGTQIKGVLDDLYTKLKDPRMGQFFQQWGQRLPKIFGTLGKAVSSLGLGLVAFFTPILPYAQKLANVIKRLADTFLKWASSVSGQNSIADFMEKAWSAASKLWKSLGNIVKGLANIFSIAFDSGGGAGFLSWLEQITQRFADWTDSVGGKNAIKEFFKDVAKTGKQVKDIIGDIWEAFKKLNTEENREQFSSFLSGLKKVISAGKTVIGWIETFNNALNGIWDTATKAGDGVSTFGDKVKTAIGKVKDFVNSDWFSLDGLGDKMEAAFDGIDWSGIWETFKTAGSKAWDRFKTGVTDAIGALAGGLLTKIINAVFGGDDKQGEGGPASQKGKSTGRSFLTSIWTGITENLGMLLGQLATLPARLISGMGPINMQAKGREIITSIRDGIVAAGTFLVTGFNLVIGWLRNTVAPNLMSKGREIITSVRSGIVAAGTWLTSGFNLVIGWLRNTVVPNLTAKGRQIITSVRNGFNIARGIITGGFRAALNWVRSVAVPNVMAKGRQLITKVRDGFNAARGVIVGGFRAALNWVRTVAVPNISEKGRQLMTFVKRGIDGARSWARSAAQAAINLVRGINAPNIAEKGRQLMTFIKRGIDGAQSWARSAAQSAINLVRGISAPNIAAKGREIVGSLRDGISGAASWVRQAAQSAADWAKGIGIPDLSGIGRSIIGGLVRGIRSAAGSVRSALGGITAMIPSWKGPPKKDRVLLTPAGQMIMQSLVNGINDERPNLKAALSEVTRDIKTIGPVRQAFYKMGQSATESMADGVASSTSEVRRALMDATLEMDRRLPGRISTVSDAYVTRTNISEGGIAVDVQIGGTIDMANGVGFIKKVSKTNPGLFYNAYENGKRRKRQ